MKIASIEPLIDGYLAYCSDVRRRAPRTVIDMRCTFTRLAGFIAHQNLGKESCKLSLDDFLRWVERERESGQSVKTIGKELSHLRGFLDYAWRSGHVDRNVLDGFCLQDANRPTPPRVLTIEDVSRLIKSSGRRTVTDRRDRLIILILYGCGLRTGELCALCLQDVDRDRQELFIRRAKGDVERRIPVPGGVWIELLAYLADRGLRAGALFRTDIKRRSITKSFVCRVVEAASTRAGLPDGITPKTLRHTFATHLMERGVSLAVIASLMGHRSPRESGVYLHALPTKCKTAVETLGQELEGVKR